MTISKEIAELRATNYGSAKVGFQVAIQYCIEQSFKGNADAATRIFTLARMLNAKGELLADGKSVLDYLEFLGVPMLAHDKDKGTIRMVKDWQASVSGVDLSELWIAQQQTPWASWKKITAPPAAPTLAILTTRFEKAVDKLTKVGTAVTATDKETVLGQLALLTSIIESMPEAEPEADPEPLTVTARCEPELSKQIVAECRAEEAAEQAEQAELTERVTKHVWDLGTIMHNLEAATDDTEADYWAGIKAVHDSKGVELRLAQKALAARMH